LHLSATREEGDGGVFHSFHAFGARGSLASSFSGEPRSSIHVDIVVDMSPAQVHPFVETLGDAFYADEDALRRAVTNRATTNLVHHASGIKVDIFVARSAFDVRQLERRQLVRIGTEPERHWFVHTPEDILLQKMLWYRQDGKTSDRQWRDLLGILIVQGTRLDDAYVNATAAYLGVADLLDRARRDAGHDA
jgi:hypothetical protein